MTNNTINQYDYNEIFDISETQTEKTQTAETQDWSLAVRSPRGICAKGDTEL